MSGRIRLLLGAGGLAILGVGLVAAALNLVVVRTALQEVSYRWMGFAGLGLLVGVVSGVLALVGAVLALVEVRTHRWILLSALLPWFVVAEMAAPTAIGMAFPERASGGDEFSVIAQNLWYENEDPSRTAEALVGRGADVLVLTEFTPEFERAFDTPAMRRSYPHRWIRAAPLGAGIAVLSTLELDSAIDLPLSTSAAQIGLVVGDAIVMLVAIHPVAPSDIYSLPKWKHDYDVLRARIGEMGPDTVVAGDFNATRGHRRFRQLKQQGDLRDAQDAAGTGFGATWPAAALVPPVMRLDHVLVGPGIGVVGFELLDRVGSDHLGVEARLQVPRQ